MVSLVVAEGCFHRAGSAYVRKTRERAKSDNRGSITLKLTPEQQEQVRQATGKLRDTLEMSIMELEERIAPAQKGRI
jgi:hypothetical protein